MRQAALAVLLALILGYPQANPPQQPKGPDKAAQGDQRGTDSNPLAIKVIPPEDAERKAEKQQNIEEQKTAREERLINATVVLAITTFFLAVFTGGLWLATYRLSRDAKETSTAQAKKMEASIAEAAKSAASIEKIAVSMGANVLLVTRMQENLPKQMRAYVAVNIAGATYQDDAVKFAGDARIENTGHTPARKVCFEIEAAAIPYPPPPGYVFPPPKTRISNDLTLNPRNSVSIKGIVENRFHEQDVAEIMNSQRRRLYVWGSVAYEDVFGNGWLTNFCHSYYFFRREDGTVGHSGQYHQEHNDAT